MRRIGQGSLKKANDIILRGLQNLTTGTQLWSEEAPIAIQHHPYNRSDVLECNDCKRTFLHYTEYGGYYLDERIRELKLNLIV